MQCRVTEICNFPRVLYKISRKDIFDSKYAQSKLFFAVRKLIRTKINANNVGLSLFNYALNGFIRFSS